MEFRYSEEEFQYFVGMREAISYYKKTKELGFDVLEDQDYYVDFEGYHASQGGYEGHVYADIMYSILSPMLGKEGDVGYSESMDSEATQFMKDKGILISDHVKMLDEEEGYILDGVYIHLAHPIILEFLDKYLDRPEFEEARTTLQNLMIDDSGFFEDLAEGPIENLFQADRGGIYMFLTIGTVYYPARTAFYIIDFMKYICSVLEAEKNEKP